MEIQVKELSKIYGTQENQVVALNRASLTIHQGDFISIMGPSGSGKSTLLHLISGLDLRQRHLWQHKYSPGQRPESFCFPAAENRVYLSAISSAPCSHRP